MGTSRIDGPGKKCASMLLGGNQHNTVTLINFETYSLLRFPGMLPVMTLCNRPAAAGHLPGSRPSLQMTKEAFLSNDGDGVTRASRDGGEYIIPDTCFVFLLY